MGWADCKAGASPRGRSPHTQQSYHGKVATHPLPRVWLLLILFPSLVINCYLVTM